MIDETISRPSRTTAAAVSSHDVSIPNTSTLLMYAALDDLAK
jgi:hypothetical protein